MDPYQWASSLVAQMVKNLPAIWETWARSLGWDDPLEEGKATHSSILARRVPLDRGAWHATDHGVSIPNGDLNKSSKLILQDIVKNREAWPAAVHGVAKSQTQRTLATLCDPMDCSRPCFPVLHCLLKY